jgi:hypothetical protein
LGDARVTEVLARLEAEAAELAGEPVLGQLVETASEELTRLNAPGEPCAFCLEPQAPEEPSGGGGAGAGPPRLLRLPCYHCFHLCAPARPPGCHRRACVPLSAWLAHTCHSGDSATAGRACAERPAGQEVERQADAAPAWPRSACFARFWRWAQRAAAAQRARVAAELGAAAPAAAALSAAGCVPDAAGRFPVRCPACRLAVPAAALGAVALARLDPPADGKPLPAGSGDPGRGGAAHAGDERGAAAAAAAGERCAGERVGERGGAGSAEWAGGAPAAEDRAVRLAGADLARLRLAQQANAERFCRQQAAVRARPPVHAHPMLRAEAGSPRWLVGLLSSHQIAGVRACASAAWVVSHA